MIDNLSILLSHGLITLMLYFLLNRDDLDVEAPPKHEDRGPTSEHRFRFGYTAADHHEDDDEQDEGDSPAENQPRKLRPGEMRR